LTLKADGEGILEEGVGAGLKEREVEGRKLCRVGNGVGEKGLVPNDEETRLLLSRFENGKVHWCTEMGTLESSRALA